MTTRISIKPRYFLVLLPYMCEVSSQIFESRLVLAIQNAERVLLLSRRTACRWSVHLTSHGYDVAKKPLNNELHNALGVGEQYHYYLLQLFHCSVDSYNNINNHDALSLAVNADIDMSIPDNFVFALPIIGFVSCFPEKSQNLPAQDVIRKPISTITVKVVKFVSLAHLFDELLTKAPVAADQDLRIGKKVLF